MKNFDSLNSEERAKVDSKLAELQENTSQSWEYEITQQPRFENQLSLLEVTVDGRTARPIALQDRGSNPADVICSELDRLAQHRSGS